MLRITIPGTELWDEAREVFVRTKEQTLCLEHSLVSLAKWESKWHKPFLLKATPKTLEETMDYVRCMTLTQNVDPDIYHYLTNANIEAVNRYIEDPMTATTFSDEQSGKTGRRVITAEVIYCSMIAHGIPFECQKWHLNRLITLIRVCEAESKPPKKMSQRALMSRNSSLNAKRRKKHHTRG